MGAERQAERRDVFACGRKRGRVTRPEDKSLDPDAAKRHPVGLPAIGIFDVAMSFRQPGAELVREKC